METQVHWKGHVTMIVYDLQGREIDRQEIDNEIKTVGLTLIAGALNGVDAEIKYMAWGSSAADNAVSQTKLVAELGRKAVTSQAAGTAGVMTTNTYIAPYEANTTTIEELGWFAGSAATATKDTGVLIARVLYSHAKTALESILCVRTDTFTDVTP
jgi:hypothetical protein